MNRPSPGATGKRSRIVAPAAAAAVATAVATAATSALAPLDAALAGVLVAVAVVVARTAIDAGVSWESAPLFAPFPVGVLWRRTGPRGAPEAREQARRSAPGRGDRGTA